MIIAFWTLRPILVAVLAMSLIVSPFCPMSVGAACPLAQSDDSHLGRCCCGENCHCENCPAMHPGQQQPKNQAPVNQSDIRDLAKIASTASTLHISTSVSILSTLATASTMVGKGPLLQTLIAQHTCLRV